MRRKSRVLLALIVIACATILLWPAAVPVSTAKIDSASTPVLVPTPLAEAPPEPNAPFASVASGLAQKPAGSSLAADLNSPAHAPQEDVEVLHAMLRQYQHRLHHRPGLPIGDDIDLAKVLTGHNPMKAVILPPDHPSLTADGHLRDRWGKPYFIHARGGGAFEIRSAGPDGKLFTADDLVANPPRTDSSEPLGDEP